MAFAQPCTVFQGDTVLRALIGPSFGVEQESAAAGSTTHAGPLGSAFLLSAPELVQIAATVDGLECGLDKPADGDRRDPHFSENISRSRPEITDQDGPAIVQQAPQVVPALRSAAGDGRWPHFKHEKSAIFSSFPDL